MVSDAYIVTKGRIDSLVTRDSDRGRAFSEERQGVEQDLDMGGGCVSAGGGTSAVDIMETVELCLE